MVSEIPRVSVFGYFPLPGQAFPDLIYMYIVGEVNEYRQCQNTYTLGISETIHPTKIYLMNKIFIFI